MNRITLTLLAGVAALGFASSSYAADLIVQAPVVSEPGYVAAAGNWDGVYIGAFVGYGKGDYNVVDSTADDIAYEGWLLGAAVGTNFTIGNGVVAGVVADIAWTNQQDDAEAFKVDWTGSVRGKLGFDGGAFLPYLTAGLAVAGADLAGETNTHIGWTVGAGVEFAVADNISLDLLYRYSDYGAQEYSGVDHSFNSHAITAGINFKF
jgi:outer membrane immunogenic protein